MAKKDISLLQKGFNKKEKFLFKSYLDGRMDRTIAKDVYNCTPSHQTYQSLKRGLTEKLLEGIVSAKTGTEIQRVRTRIYRNTAVINILDVLGLRKLFVPLARKTLQKCLKYHMYIEAAGIARLLTHHYIVYEKDSVAGNEYYDILQRSLDTFRLESKAQYEYSKMQLLYQGHSFEKHIRYYRELADSIRAQSPPFESIRLTSLYYLIRYAQYVASNDLENRIRISREAIDYLESLDFKSDITKNIFIFNLVDSFLETKQLTRAELILLSYIQNTTERSFQYYRFRELLFRIYLYQGKTELVNEEFEFLKSNIRKMESVFTRNRLLVYQIYVDILNGVPSNFRKINYNLNRVKQDKKGLHVPLLIGQAVQSFIHAPDRFIDNYDALKQYCYRHLNSDGYLRTNEFVRYLGKMLDAGAGTAGEKIFNQGLVSTNSLEMINYDLLAKLTLESSKSVV